MLFDLFKIGIWRCEAKSFIPYTNNWFQENELLPRPNDNGFRTSLSTYKNKTQNDLIVGEGVEEFKLFLINNAKQFLTTCGYDMSIDELHINRIWLNEMASGSEHSLHSHYGNVISGCFYVELPEGSSEITFTNPTTLIDKLAPQSQIWTPYNSEIWNINPVVGDCFMWESYLKHKVNPLKFDGIRRSIAFDLGW